MSKSDRKARWRNVSITDDNVDQYLQDLYDDTKAQYINQGVSFNKDDPYQMGLLRLAFLEPMAFSGLCKQLLANYFKNKAVISQEIGIVNIPPAHIKPSQPEAPVEPKRSGESPSAQPPAHQPTANTGTPRSLSTPTRRGGKLSGLME